MDATQSSLLKLSGDKVAEIVESQRQKEQKGGKRRSTRKGRGRGRGRGRGGGRRTRGRKH